MSRPVRLVPYGAVLVVPAAIALGLAVDAGASVIRPSSSSRAATAPVPPISSGGFRIVGKPVVFEHEHGVDPASFDVAFRLNKALPTFPKPSELPALVSVFTVDGKHGVDSNFDTITVGRPASHCYGVEQAIDDISLADVMRRVRVGDLVRVRVSIVSPDRRGFVVSHLARTSKSPKRSNRTSVLRHDLAARLHC